MNRRSKHPVKEPRRRKRLRGRWRGVRVRVHRLPDGPIGTVPAAAPDSIGPTIDLALLESIDAEERWSAQRRAFEFRLAGAPSTGRPLIPVRFQLDDDEPSRMVIVDGRPPTILDGRPVSVRSIPSATA